MNLIALLPSARSNPLITLLCVGVISSVLIGCTQTGRYHHRQDSAPRIVPEHVSQADALPQYEPYAAANMRPYTVHGVRYQPLSTGKGFSEHGEASWYGQKFHGHQTANGEIYNMYHMSGAHKTLPLPSYARITNLENGKQVVIRINDRGPFHINRVVDLSYAAAAKLDMLKTGVAKVKLDVIHIDAQGQTTVGRTPPISQVVASTSQAKSTSTDESVASANKSYLQIAASRDVSKLNGIAQQLSKALGLPSVILSSQRLHKLRLGPVPQSSNTQALLKKLASMGYPQSFVVRAAR